MPQLLATLTYLSQNYLYYIRGDRSPLNCNLQNPYCNVSYLLIGLYLIMSPLYRGGGITLTAHLFVTNQFCVCAFSVYRAGGQTRDYDPMPGYCRPTVYDAEPALAQSRVTVSCLTLRWMWASVTDGGPTLTQPLFFNLNRPKCLKNKQKTATKHTGTLECGYPTSLSAD